MKRNNVPNDIRSSGYDLCSKNVVMKCVEQTNGHEAARKYIVSRSKHPKIETTKTGT
jgi:hypothetical protein